MAIRTKKTKPIETKPLTPADLKNGLRVINRDNPDWGFWFFRQECGSWVLNKEDRRGAVAWLDDWNRWLIVL